MVRKLSLHSLCYVEGIAISYCFALKWQFFWVHSKKDKNTQIFLTTVWVKAEKYRKGGSNLTFFLRMGILVIAALGKHLLMDHGKLQEVLNSGEVLQL